MYKAAAKDAGSAMTSATRPISMVPASTAADAEVARVGQPPLLGEEAEPGTPERRQRLPQQEQADETHQREHDECG